MRHSTAGKSSRPIIQQPGGIQLRPTPIQFCFLRPLTNFFRKESRLVDEKQGQTVARMTILFLKFKIAQVFNAHRGPTGSNTHILIRKFLHAGQNFLFPPRDLFPPAGISNLHRGISSRQPESAIPSPGFPPAGRNFLFPTRDDFPPTNFINPSTSNFFFLTDFPLFIHFFLQKVKTCLNSSMDLSLFRQLPNDFFIFFLTQRNHLQPIPI